MQTKNPKQHVHTWELAFTKTSGWKAPGGFDVKRYYRCIRGGKIKHTEAAPTYLGDSFLRASGFGEW